MADLRAWDLVKNGFRKVTRATLGDHNPLTVTMPDATGKILGESGYTGQPVQLVDENGNPIDPAEDIVIAAGENHIGEVGGNTKILRLNPTIDTSQYDSGECIGGVLTITDAMRKNAGTGLISNMVCAVASNSITPALEVILFSTTPASSTTTNNAAFVLHADDINKRIASFTILSTDYNLTGGVYRAKSQDAFQAIESAAGSKNIFAVIIAKANVTFPSSTALHIKMDNMRD